MRKIIAFAIAIVFCFTVFASAEPTDETQSEPKYSLGSLLPDCAIYLKNPDALSKEAFEEYASSLGFDIILHPDFQLLTDDGLCPVRLQDNRFVQNDGGNLFMTGFESYPLGWLNNTYVATKPNEEGASFVLLLRCYSGIDYFGPLTAYLFGAYCVKYCKGVFEDFEGEMRFDDLTEIEREIAVFTDELISEAKQGRLCSCPFDGWLGLLK